MGDTFRMFEAMMMSLVLTGLTGPWAIALLRRWREPNVSDSPRLAALHAAKDQTPTMGGLWFLAAWLVALVGCVGLPGPMLGLALGATLSLAALGAWDDVRKIRTKRGLLAKRKLGMQLLLATATLVGLLAIDGDWLSHHAAPLGPSHTIPVAAACLLALLAIVGTANAVNLTDGLDGLAGGCVALVLAPLAGAAWIAGDATLASQFHVPPVDEGKMLALATAALLGAVLAFLYYNRHPARVFMGNTGALALGGWIGCVAVVLRQELWLLVLGGVLAAETLSVLLQVGSFRLTGRRVLRCAPLHHHFQFLGWREARVVRLFWTASAACALFAATGFIGRAMWRPHQAAETLATDAQEPSQSPGPLANASGTLKSKYRR